jgi:hypothetical protein
MKRHAWLVALVLLAALNAGCVTRRYVITSDPPGANVYRNGQLIGATPVEEQFVYYGKYHFVLVKDGYEPFDEVREVAAPWYEYPGLDFVFENLVAFTLRDVHRIHYVLQPLRTVRHDDVRQAAEVLRARGKLIPSKPAAPKPDVGTPAVRPPIPPTPRILPPGQPVPPAGPAASALPASSPRRGTEEPPPDPPPSRSDDEPGVRGGAPLGPSAPINPPSSR